VTRLSTGAFAVLVAATIGAFFVTQHLKVTTPLIQGYPRPVPGMINPLHGVRCIDGRNSGSTTISFYLQHRGDEVDVYVVDAEGNIVSTVATGRHMRKNVRNPDGVFHWDGRLDNGRVAPDGTYYFRVALIHQNRTIDLTDVPVKVKTVPPRPVVVSVSPSVIPTPAGSRSVTIRYAGNENRGGTILLYRTDLPGGPRLVKTFLTPWDGHTAVWDGRVLGRPAPPGSYLVGIEVTDAACNTGRWPPRIAPTPAVMSRAGVTVK
jgi:FlgD Ig-like domain